MLIEILLFLLRPLCHSLFVCFFNRKARYLERLGLTAVQMIILSIAIYLREDGSGRVPLGDKLEQQPSVGSQSWVSFYVK